MIPLDAPFDSTRRGAMLVLTRKIGDEIIIDEEICAPSLTSEKTRYGLASPPQERQQ
jgi:hypothetical protein